MRIQRKEVPSISKRKYHRVKEFVRKGKRVKPHVRRMPCK